MTKVAGARVKFLFQIDKCLLHLVVLHLSHVGDLVSMVGDQISVVRDPVPLVRDPIPFIRRPLACL